MLCGLLYVGRPLFFLALALRGLWSLWCALLVARLLYAMLSSYLLIYRCAVFGGVLLCGGCFPDVAFGFRVVLPLWRLACVALGLCGVWPLWRFLFFNWVWIVGRVLFLYVLCVCDDVF